MFLSCSVLKVEIFIASLEGHVNINSWFCDSRADSCAEQVVIKWQLCLESLKKKKQYHDEVTLFGRFSYKEWSPSYVGVHI
jgi:hypothetical protein